MFQISKSKISVFVLRNFFCLALYLFTRCLQLTVIATIVHRDTTIQTSLSQIKPVCGLRCGSGWRGSYNSNGSYIAPTSTPQLDSFTTMLPHVYSIDEKR